MVNTSTRASTIADEVLAVIVAESAAFWNKDYDAWSACWVHVPYPRTMGWWAVGGVSVVEGWEAQSGAIRRVMQASPEANPTAARVRRENVNVQIHDTVTWVTLDHYGVDTGDSTMDMPGLSRGPRILERHGGQWKIVYAGWLLEGA